MKKIYLITLLFAVTGIYAQNNFYSGLETFYQTHPKPDGEGEEIESSEYNEVKRIERDWGPRLFAHGGDGSVAAAAMIDYAESYIPVMSQLDPEWRSVGPNREINGNYGVGRIERICFDPQYDSVTYQVLYATSSFGGLWRTENDGEYWEPLTDFLPFTADADVAVSYQNSNNIFLATGYADGRFEYNNEFNHINAYNTFGIYRSTDYGGSWEAINDGFIEEFIQGGGMARRILINPEDENQLFVATTRGVYRCNNAMDEEPTWQKVINISEPSLNDFRGLAFMPGNPNTVYASGTEIFKSTDGGLNFSLLPIDLLPVDYEIHQINIATTPADPDRLYAYVVGKADSETKKRIFIFIHSYLAEDWVQIHTDESEGGTFAMGKGRMALAVSPVNPNEFYFGFTLVAGTPDYTTTNVSTKSGYNNNNCHADIHSLAFQPNMVEPDLFAGTDGGVGRKELPNNGIYGWTMLYNGLSVNTIFGFDDSDFDHTKIMIGNIDCGTNKVSNYDTEDWKHLAGGDGYGVRFDKSSLNNWFFKPNFGLIPLRHDYTTNFYNSEDGLNPLVCPNNHSNGWATGRLPFFNHPVTNNVYMGFEEIFNRLKQVPESGDQWADLWLEESDMYNTGMTNWTRQIEVMKISESNPDYIYAITVGVQNDPFDTWALAARILKSTSGGINGDCNNTAFSIVEYPGYNPDPQTFFPIVSNLTVDPNNENRFWITYTGFVPEYKVYRTDDGGATWENEDPNGTLANIPVNDIIYQYGSNDRLFIGTDAGVYIKDGPDADWEKFGNIPNVRVNRLKINYCANLLRAGTFGRGLWETEITAFDDFTHKTIDEDVVWETNWSLKGNLIIETGNTLTIKEVVNMPPNSIIIIEPGAKLIVDGGHITNGCDQTWQGIEVHGHPTSPFPSDQGELIVKNGAIIENAEMAVRNYHFNNGTIPPDEFQGGIIKANNSTFRNNIKTIDLRNFDYNSFNSFIDCEFIYNDAYLGSGTPGYFMEIRDMRIVSILSCDFTNNTALNQVGKGIYSYNSQVSVKGKCVSAVEPCTEWENANFTNLEYGIYATAPSSTNYVDVRNVSFTNNYRGLYIGGITTPRVTSSEFFVIDDNNGYGLYLDESTGFWVEDNVFNGAGDKKGTGIIVNDVGPAANEIYLNEFNNLQFSINAQGRNRNHLQMNEGLVLKCNDYNDTQFDESILWDSPFISKDAGIAGDQGIDNLNIEDMAGNLFFINIGGFNDYDDINNEANQIDYYFSTDALSYNVEPMDATWNTVDKHGKFTSLWTYETACEPGINNGGGIEEERSKMDAAQSDIESTEAILAALVDGGDTEALNTDVETSTPPETVTVYNELMGKSPNLSETVVESTIEQETVLPNAMVRDVMVANPHTAKSQVLLDMLDERFDPMPDYMKAQILAGRSIQTLKQELESGLAGYKLQKAKAMNAIVSYYREELEDPADVSDSLLALFQADNTLNSAYRIAWLYLERDEYQQGLNVMGDIPSLFGLDEEGQQDYTNISGIYTMLSGLYQNGNTIESLSETELAGLQTLTVGDAGLARAYARNILIALGELEYDEPILQPDFLKSSMALEDYNELLKAEAPQQLQVYPNPSKGYVILEYKIETEAEGLIEIKDITGKTIKTIPATEKQDQVTVITENWQTGVYIANLTVNGKSIESVKFTIVK